MAYSASGTRCTRFGDGLTPKEMRFCEEYVKDFNGAAAVRRANLCPNKPEHAPQYASRYLAKQEVKDYIQQLMNVISEKCTVEVDDLLKFWSTIMNDPNESTPNRLKSSDYIAKVIGAYNVKVDVQQAPTIVMDIGLPPGSPPPLAIEAGVEMLIDDEDDNDEDSEDYDNRDNPTS